MLKRLLAACMGLVLLLFFGGACADSWSGIVTALETVQVISPAKGIPEQLNLEAGACVAEGEIIGTIRPEKVFRLLTALWQSSAQKNEMRFPVHCWRSPLSVCIRSPVRYPMSPKRRKTL